MNKTIRLLAGLLLAALLMTLICACGQEDDPIPPTASLEGAAMDLGAFSVYATSMTTKNGFHLIKSEGSIPAEFTSILARAEWSRLGTAGAASNYQIYTSEGHYLYNEGLLYDLTKKESARLSAEDQARMDDLTGIGAFSRALAEAMPEGTESPTLMIFQYMEHSNTVTAHRFDGGYLSTPFSRELIALIDALESTEETVEALGPSHSLDAEQLKEYGVSDGTVWIQIGAGGKTYRISPDFGEIAFVARPLDGGIKLRMSEALRTKLVAGWAQYSYNTYEGSFRDGDLTLSRINVQFAGVSVAVKEFKLAPSEDGKHEITLCLRSHNKQQVDLKLTSNQGTDEKEHLFETLSLEFGDYRELTYTFEGKLEAGAWLHVLIENTVINIKIEA